MPSSNDLVHDFLENEEQRTQEQQRQEQERRDQERLAIREAIRKGRRLAGFIIWFVSNKLAFQDDADVSLDEAEDKNRRLEKLANALKGQPISDNASDLQRQLDDEQAQRFDLEHKLNEARKNLNDERAKLMADKRDLQKELEAAKAELNKLKSAKKPSAPPKGSTGDQAAPTQKKSIWNRLTAAEHPGGDDS